MTEFTPAQEAIMHIIKDAGKREERDRIVDILEHLPAEFNMNDYSVRTIAVALERIYSA